MAAARIVFGIVCLIPYSLNKFMAPPVGQAFIPPSTVRFAPVMYEDSGPATNATSPATSATCPARSSGTTAFRPTAHSPEAGSGRCRSTARGSADSAFRSVSGHRIGYERQGCFRAIDVVLHRGCPTHPDRPDDFAVHLDGEPPSVRRHARQRGDAGQERRVALDEAEEVLRGDAEQSCVRLVLRDLDGADRSPI